MTVYITQDALRKDPQTGAMVPQFDLTPAAVYGPLAVLAPAGQVALAPAPLMRHLRAALKDFGDGDYLLPIGDPSVMVAAGMIAANANRGRVKVLKWDNRTRRYIAVTLNTYGGDHD